MDNNNKKQGRPPKREQSRTAQTNVRLAPDELSQIKEAQQLTGMTLADVLTAWAKSVLKIDKKRQ